MDLRSILDNSDAGDRGKEREQRERERAAHQQQQPPTPQQQSHQIPPHHQQQQSPASYPYRDYSHPSQPHPSPGKPSRQEYPTHPTQHASYPQSPYQQPNAYPRQSGPPSLQPAGSFHDPRSPTGMPAPSPTAYRPTPTHAPAGASGGYPFPQQDVTSPSMRHQYPPSQYPPQPQRQESYPRGAAQYAQQPVPAPAPHPSPVATPGPHGYPQPQRSQSQHSTPTPTSAHSQQQYGSSYVHGSPVAMSHAPPGDTNRQTSQPPTPHGAPLSATQRQTTGHEIYAQQQQTQQPASPYNQRPSSTPTQPAHPHPSPHLQQQHAQPPPQHAPAQRPPHDPLAEHRRPVSHHSRDHSLSVSPKTRVPSLPSNADRTSQSVDRDHRPLAPEPMAIDTERATTPAKRKLDDRDLSPQDLERKVPRPPPGQINGEHLPKRPDRNVEAEEMSKPPPNPRKIRKRYQEPPIWAQNCRTLNGKLPKHENFVLAKRTHSHLNGGQATPEKRRSQPPPKQPPPPKQIASDTPADQLGKWEASITGKAPIDEIAKQVTDFLFLNVVTHEDAQEIASRGIKYEIEAKLGTLIDRDMNQRVNRDVTTECLLGSSSRVAFKSSMTTAHHKFFNDYLNELVKQSHPGAGTGRLPLVYRHHKQTDSFIELTPELQKYVPGCMTRQQSGRRSQRVRISRDQETKEIIAKIVKSRVGDLDLHLPTSPMDCRISVNLEWDWDGPTQELEALAARQKGTGEPDRNKDRVTYTHGHYQVDLTQVTQQTVVQGHTKIDREHELEVELNPDILIDQGHKAMSGQKHRLPELIEGLVDNIRVLAGKANDMR